MDGPESPLAETDAVRLRYARRASSDVRYSRLTPAALLGSQERERAISRFLRAKRCTDVAERSLFEVGCGSGDNLLEMLRLGFVPGRLRGIELLEERCARARARLPAAIDVALGDARNAAVDPASVDIVLQSTVFSSLLDDAFQQALADAMWRWVKPGGAVLWYDFTVDNPRNPDVRGVPLRRIRALFPEGEIDARRVTLAPPIARAVTRVHPALYTLFNTVPMLRTHLLAWIGKR